PRPPPFPYTTLFRSTATRRSPGAVSRAIPIVTVMPGSEVRSPAIVANPPGPRDWNALPRGGGGRQGCRLPARSVCRSGRRHFVEMLPEVLHRLVERRVHRAHDR